MVAKVNVLSTLIGYTLLCHKASTHIVNPTLYMVVTRIFIFRCKTYFASLKPAVIAIYSASLMV